MLKLKPYIQTKSNCGPTSLRIVLGYYNINKSEKYLAKLSGCTIKHGTEPEGLLKAAESLGLKGFVKYNSDIKDIRKYVVNKTVPVIVNWFSISPISAEGHYSVVVDINRNNIYLMDPESGSIRKIKLSEFKKLWFDFKGEFINSNDDLILRAMIVIYK